MVSVRKRKMARSSVPKNTRREKDKHRAPKIAHHPVLAARWDKRLTLKQNYAKFGLASRLKGYTGGEEKTIKTLTELKKEKEEQEKAAHRAPEEIAEETDPSKIPEGEARLIRDPETNEVTKIIYGTMKVTVTEEPKQDNEIINELREYAEEHASAPKAQKPKDEEAPFLEKLHEKYGDDYGKMKWDKKLNPFFFSEGQLKKKIGVWKEANGIQ